jgi:hypothetical protein
MPNGSSPTRPRTHWCFQRLLLIVFGFLILLHNYGHLQLGGIFKRLVAADLHLLGSNQTLRSVRSRNGAGPQRVDGSLLEVFLVIGLMIVVLGVIAVEEAPHLFEGMDINFGGEPYSFPIDIDPQPIAPNARILIRGGRGPSPSAFGRAHSRITGQKAIRTFSETDAQKRPLH